MTASGAIAYVLLVGGTIVLAAALMFGFRAIKLI